MNAILSNEEINRVMTSLNKKQMEHAEQADFIGQVQGVITKSTMLIKQLQEEIKALKLDVKNKDKELNSLKKKSN